MRASLAIILALLLTPLSVARAAEPGKEVEVSLGAAKHVKMGSSISRVAVGSNDIADVAAFPPDQILITGKRIGRTTATLWTSGSDKVVTLTIDVDYPLEAISKALEAALPGAKGIKVTSAGTSLVLAGQVDDVAQIERAAQVANGVLGAATAGGFSANLINAMTVKGESQVQLEVSFAEVSRTALRQIGFNFWHRDSGGDFFGGISSPSQAAGTVAGVDPTLGVTGSLPVLGSPLAGAFGLVFVSGGSSDFPFSAALSILSSRGYARTLSEPTLVAMSGQEAKFTAGGEFPLLVPQSLGQVIIEWKKFGVELGFVPTVLGDTIQLRLNSAVSDIDTSLGIKLASVTVPGITSRSSSTTIRLKDGQSFAIAGLLSDKVRSNVDKVPWLGDLPVLGALFRSTSYRRDETELLVVVTARLVRPLDERPGLPGQDMTTDPSDLSLFLFGTAEPSKTERDKDQSKPAGPVGFQR